MKNILKAAGAVACAAAVLCASGCSNTKWAYKTDKAELGNGQWIYCTFEGLSLALTEIQKNDENADMSSIDWDKQEIEGEPAKDWIYAKAKETGLNYLMMEGLAVDNGITVDEDSYNASKSYYSYFYNNYYHDLFTELGVSEDSYCTVSIRPNIISDKLFNKMYGTGGVREVPQADLEKFFLDNYVSYYYVSCDLKKTENDEKVDLDKETLDKYREDFRKYAAMLNNDKKPVSDVTEQYKTDFGVTEDPSKSATAYKEDMESSELSNAILALEEGKAATVEIDDKLYLIYRYDIKSKVQNIKSDKEETTEDAGEVISKESILKKMRNDDYQQFLKEERDKLQYDRNDACVHKYDVSRTIDALKNAKS